MTVLRCFDNAHSTKRGAGSAVRCVVRELRGSVLVSGSPPVEARVLRGGRSYAVGWSISKPNGRSFLVLAGRRTLPAGTYTLRVRVQRHGRSVTINHKISIA